MGKLSQVFPNIIITQICFSPFSRCESDYVSVYRGVSSAATPGSGGEPPFQTLCGYKSRQQSFLFKGEKQVLVQFR